MDNIGMVILAVSVFALATFLYWNLTHSYAEK